MFLCFDIISSDFYYFFQQFLFVLLVVICAVWLLFVLFYVLFVCKCVLPPGDNPIAVNKYINFNINTKLRFINFHTPKACR
jgi:hypothetical protein